MGIYENNNGINKHFRDDSKNASSFPKRRRRTSRRRTQKKGARRNFFCYFFIKNENIFKIDLVYKCAWIIICFIYSLLTKHSHTFFSFSFFLSSPVTIYNVLSFLFRLSSDDWVSRNVRIIFVCFLFSLLLLLLLLLLSLPFLKLIRKEFFFSYFWRIDKQNSKCQHCLNECIRYYQVDRSHRHNNKLYRSIRSLLGFLFVRAVFFCSQIMLPFINF